MTAPTSQISFGGVDVSGYASLGLTVAYEDIGGFTILRQMDGTGVRQQAWTKKRITLNCTGWAPTALRALNYSTTKSLTVPDPEGGGGTETYTVFAELREQHAINTGDVSWLLVCEEE